MSKASPSPAQAAVADPLSVVSRRPTPAELAWLLADAQTAGRLEQLVWLFKQTAYGDLFLFLIGAARDFTGDWRAVAQGLARGEALVGARTDAQRYAVLASSHCYAEVLTALRLYRSLTPGASPDQTRELLARLEPWADLAAIDGCRAAADFIFGDDLSRAVSQASNAKSQ
jgi:hypothetical protein